MSWNLGILKTSKILVAQKGYGQEDVCVVNDPIVHSTPPNVQAEILNDELNDPVVSQSNLTLAWLPLKVVAVKLVIGGQSSAVVNCDGARK